MAREPFKASAEDILNACIVNEIEGYIAAHSISNLFYILRKSYTVDERRDMISVLCKILPVAGIDDAMIQRATK